MKHDNYFKITLPALSRNESFARAAVSAFAAQLDPTVDKIGDIKAAVSEAVTNCIVHAYADSPVVGVVEITAKIKDDTLYIKIRDKGCGIDDIKQAMTPLFTSKPEEERAGLGFAVMESCCDKLKVTSTPGKGTTVTLTVRLDKKELA